MTNNWACKLPMVKIRVCEDCLGTGARINEYNVVIMCNKCSCDYKLFKNRYGTNVAENPRFYVDAEKKILQRIDPKKDYVLLPNGEVVERVK